MSHISIIINLRLGDKKTVVSLSEALWSDNITSPEYAIVKSIVINNELILSIDCRSIESTMHTVNDLLRCLKAAYDSLIKIKRYN